MYEMKYVGYDNNIWMVSIRNVLMAELSDLQVNKEAGKDDWRCQSLNRQSQWIPNF